MNTLEGKAIRFTVDSGLSVQVVSCFSPPAIEMCRKAIYKPYLFFLCVYSSTYNALQLLVCPK